MKRTLNLLVLVTLLALTFGAQGVIPAQASPTVPNVLLVGADPDGQPLITLLPAFGDLGTVSFFDVRSGTPTLALLLAYDVVIAYNDYSYADRVAMGNVLADYVDAGGKVILTAFNWQYPTSFGLAGRMVTGSYSPFIGYASNHYTYANLGAYTAGHPIMQGVTAVSDQYRDYVNLDPGATLVASWNDGEEMIATKGSVVALNLYSGSSYVWTGDVALIFHNSICWLTGGCAPSDTTPPVLTLPANMTVPQSIPAGAVVNFSATATDETSPANPVVTCVPPSGSTFPLGTTTVNCEATDDAGNTAYGSFDVTVTAGVNLLKKPDFASATVFPNPWRAFGFRPPYTAALDCNYYNFGSCSVVFGPGNRAAFQQVNRTGVAGDTYSFGMYSASQNAPIGGDYRIEVSFFNNLNKLVNKYTVYFNPLTHGFELASDQRAAFGNYNKIIFRFIYNNSSGRAWFDDGFLYFLGNIP